MRLVVLAGSELKTREDSSGDEWILRLAGTPQPNEVSPPEVIDAADVAGAEIRSKFPHWLWEWVQKNGALDLAVFQGLISWWWFTPLSEKSLLRSPLIRELYWLLLFDEVLRRASIDSVEWHGDDAPIGGLAAKIASERRVAFRSHLVRRPLRRRLLWQILGRVRFSLKSVLVWGLLRRAGLRRTKANPRPTALFFSRFPVLWERASPRWRERMFGRWNDFLETKGFHPAYLCVWSGSWSDLVRKRDEWRRVCQENNVSFLEAQVSLRELIAAHFPARLYLRYLRWRWSRRGTPVWFGKHEVGALFWREFDTNVFSDEIRFDSVIATGLKSALSSFPGARAVFLPFEYQPMERAVWVGAKASRNLPVVGLQTGLFTSNQMGFTFPPEEVRSARRDVGSSPLPDVIAAYGELAYRVFAERLGNSRVCLSGALRYPDVGKAVEFDAAEFRRVHKLPERTFSVLVATGAAPEESIPLLEGAFSLAEENPEIFLLLKFHYHLPLEDQVRELATHRGIDRYRILESNLYELMRLAPAMLTAGSSVGIEAMATGTMPIVYRSPGEMSVNPMLEVPDAVFFWHSIAELRQAFQSCLARDGEYERRRTEWPKAMRAQLYQLDGLANDRLYQFLVQLGVLPGSIVQVESVQKKAV